MVARGAGAGGGLAVAGAAGLAGAGWGVVEVAVGRYPGGASQAATAAAAKPAVPASRNSRRRLRFEPLSGLLDPGVSTVVRIRTSGGMWSEPNQVTEAVPPQFGGRHRSYMRICR
jgi:hypothetical protein